MWLRADGILTIYSFLLIRATKPEKGQYQLETEIRYLQRHTLASPAALRINRDILHKQQLWQQQQERWVKEVTW